jgi:nucleoside-diphosphate-sugar epimerase
MKIIITGGLGFVGSHLAEKLCQKHNVVIFTKSFSKINNIKNYKNKVIIEKIDVTNFSKLGSRIKKHKPDMIIHLAGITSHSKSFESPLLDVDSNAKSTLFILETIRKLNYKCKFILGSTFIVIGRPNKLPVNENSICNPTTIYGTNRLASEYYCKIYNQMYNLDTRIFRITNAYGPREQIIPKKNAVNFLIYQSFKGEKITIFNEGKFFRDLIYISDVISAIQIIIKKGKSGETYWISSSKKIWFYELGKQLQKLTNSKVIFIKTPSYTKKMDVGNFVASNKKLKNLGWIPSVNITKGLQKTLEYFNLTK